MWVNHSKMLLNEFRLNPLDANAQKIMEEQMEQFFSEKARSCPKATSPQSIDPYLDVELTSIWQPYRGDRMPVAGF